ncbi:MFS transporter, PPP family, 3-phenylpropionic acid transporter [Natronincola peptidivorans]|uniref:MFS transporter, PPP family, 3-phenylpropionic acid transporter n=1 Tax=Natronincola peptidivorans TaxID=426128 RepID=A0A1H9ZZF4_9FIRM|nr:MFS transporter [Natronincola peptidivorans]SES87170.1 MFS transporter, PPP family, 3-phenylpropionic acid transporter [Natronincola peptidivorans]
MYYSLSILYSLIYFALGAMYPLLARYLEEIGLSGTEIGIITATGAVVLILAQPIWGLICDRTQKTKLVLGATILAAAIASIMLSFFQHFVILLLGFAILHLFQGANPPIVDSIVLNHTVKTKYSFGSIRQWGAVGFAVAVFISGIISERFGLKSIFYLYALAYMMALLLIKPLPGNKSNIKVGFRKGLVELVKTPQYTLIVVCALLVSGPINGNNIYFALLFKYLGGGLSGIGLAFLLFAGSEAPMMKVSGTIIKKLGLVNTLLAATMISVLRWFWYSTGPSHQHILYLFLLQGLSVGLFIVAAAQYVRENSSEELRITALTLYTSLGMGVGTIICNLLGGIIIDRFSVLATYRFFAFSSLLGIVPLLVIKYYYEKKPVL